jgi:hypothetical protein
MNVFDKALLSIDAAVSLAAKAMNLERVRGAFDGEEWGWSWQDSVPLTDTGIEGEAIREASIRLQPDTFFDRVKIEFFAGAWLPNRPEVAVSHSCSTRYLEVTTVPEVVDERTPLVHDLRCDLDLAWNEAARLARALPKIEREEERFIQELGK